MQFPEEGTNAVVGLPPIFKQFCEFIELRRVRVWPRYRRQTTKLLGPTLTLVDGRSFFYSYREIFTERIYSFQADNNSPCIIDGGANIGLSVIFFKHAYPNSRITAFEADPVVFSVLEKNIKTFALDNVALINKALWNADAQLLFRREGADAGRIATEEENDIEALQVDSIRLSKFLGEETVDFLKLDIEGAEYEVLFECKDQLHHVQNIFVEYHSFAKKEQKLDEILAVLRSVGFRVQVHTQRVSPQPLLSRKVLDGMDMQLNIFGFRET